MTVKTPPDKIETRIGALEAEIETLRKYKEAVQIVLSDEALAREVLEELLDRERPQNPVEMPKSKQLAKLRSFFLDKNNAWADTSEISEGTELEGHTIRQCVYKRYVEFFEVRPHPSDDKRKQFRWKKTT